MLAWIQSWFNVLLPSIYTANVNPCGKVWTYKIVGRKAEAVCRALLLMPTPKLARKWLKAEPFVT